MMRQVDYVFVWKIVFHFNHPPCDRRSDRFALLSFRLQGNSFLSELHTYVEGHYCVDDKRFIAYDHCGYRHLSEYAKNHKDECCLVFEIKYENIFSAIAGGVLRKTASSRKVVRFTDRNGESLVTEEGLARRKMIEKELLETQTYQKSFNQMTKELMKSNGFTIERLADETGLSVETVKNMRTEPGIRFNIEAVVSVCIAMHLSRNISEIYIDKSPAKFLDTVEMRLYKFALIHRIIKAIKNRHLSVITEFFTILLYKKNS